MLINNVHHVGSRFHIRIPHIESSWKVIILMVRPKYWEIQTHTAVVWKLNGGTRAEVIKALKTNGNPESELLRSKLTEEPWIGSPEGAEFFSTIRHRSDYMPPDARDRLPKCEEFPNETYTIAKAQFKGGELLAIAKDPRNGDSIPINLCDTLTRISIAEELLCSHNGIRIEGSPHLGKLNPKWQTDPFLIDQE
jgi:hypothetical protein